MESQHHGAIVIGSGEGGKGAGELWCMDHHRVGWGKMTRDLSTSLSGVGVMPFRANAECRHHIPKQRHRAMNSAA